MLPSEIMVYKYLFTYISIFYIHFQCILGYPLNEQAYFHSVKHKLHCSFYCYNYINVFFYKGVFFFIKELEYSGRNPCVDTLT